MSEATGSFFKDAGNVRVSSCLTAGMKGEPHNILSHWASQSLAPALFPDTSDLVWFH